MTRTTTDSVRREKRRNWLHVLEDIIVVGEMLRQNTLSIKVTRLNFDYNQLCSLGSLKYMLHLTRVLLRCNHSLYA